MEADLGRLVRHLSLERACADRRSYAVISLLAFARRTSLGMTDIVFRNLVLAKGLTVAQAPDPLAPLPTHPHRATLRSSADFLSLPRLRQTTRR
jgi:hypothetical protein